MFIIILCTMVMLNDGRTGHGQAPHAFLKALGKPKLERFGTSTLFWITERSGIFFEECSTEGNKLKFVL